MMKGQDILHTAATKLLPLLILLVLLPFLLTFDTLVYWLTRPTCMNCGSLVGFLQSESLSVFMVTKHVGELGIGNWKFGKKKS